MQITDPNQFPIPLSRAAAMRLILDHVDSGHTWWWTGTVSINKAEEFVGKMLAHGVGLDPDRRTRGRHPKPTLRDPNPVGRSTHLVMYPMNPKDPEMLTWFLLSTSPVPGEYQVNHTQHPVTWGEYELVRWARPRKIGGGEVWSWRFHKKAFEELLDVFVKAGRHRNPFILKKALFGLRQRPGWSALRQQALSCCRAAKTASRIKGKNADAFIEAMDWSLPPEYCSMRYWPIGDPFTIRTLKRVYQEKLLLVKKPVEESVG